MSQTFPPVRLAALDLDGTLLSGHSAGDARAPGQALARAAANRDVVIVPATGRPLASLPPIVAHTARCALCAHLQRRRCVGSAQRPAGGRVQPVRQRRRA